jgi:Domain of unknown function (DUF4440)
MKTDTATRSDLDALTALNSDYIHSVQHSDVQRFDEILAEDFLCSNPDGSLVDKNQFLAQTARPVTINGLSVEDVRVRILGMSRSFTRARAILRQAASSGMAAIPMSGHAGTENGSRYPRM